MPVSPTFKTIPMAPLTGLLDTRSPLGELAYGSWRFRQNFAMREEGRLRRREGWRKLLWDAPVYNNHDRHDQLLSQQVYYGERAPMYTPQSDVVDYPPTSDFCQTTQLTRTTGRQPPTLLYEAVSSAGLRRIICGTQNRLDVLNEHKGNWKIIADAYGGTPKTGLPERRWLAAGVKDIFVFTNNFDPPLAWHFDQPTSGCAMQAVSPIGDLAEIGLTKAAVICAWRGILFFADVEQDGDRVEQRVIWSDKDNATSWVPSNASLAGFQDLEDGERVFAMVPLLDYLMILTNKSIWQVSFVGGDALFNFRQVYTEPERGEACIAFPNTAASTGREVIYAGRDGIYVFNLYMAKPDRVEWIHKSSNVVFDSINTSICQAHIGGFDPVSKEYWLSWVQNGEIFPTRTMTVNTQYQFVDFIDHGFTALCNYTSDRRGSVLDFILENCICTPAQIEADPMGLDSIKEGDYCIQPTYPTCSGIDPNAPLVTDQTIEIDGVLVEDLDGPVSPNSLCARLGDLSIEDICQECNAQQLFVVASAVDWSLKQVGGAYFREECTVFTDCGTYVKRGYDSILRNVMGFGKPMEDKTMRELELGAESEDQTVPSTVQLRVGYSATAQDPNSVAGRCSVIWRDQKPKELKCLTDADMATHIAKNTRPARTLNWPLFYTGRYLYVEIKVTGQGGASSFSHLNFDMRQNPRSETS